jgi:ankyrin repeat protein
LETLAILLYNDRKLAGIVNSVGETPLHFACREGYSTAVNLLLECDTEVCNMRSDIGWTPLHECAERGWIETIRLLLSNTAVDTQIQDNVSIFR